MRFVCSVAALLAFAAAPALAGDGRVPQSKLANLGLGNAQVLTDSEGMQIRGMGRRDYGHKSYGKQIVGSSSSNALASGRSLVVGLLIDPATNSFVFGSDTNSAASSSENGGLNAPSSAFEKQSSGLGLDLNVVTATSKFDGVLNGGAGGFGFAIAR
jgi:hypothetical protein